MSEYEARQKRWIRSVDEQDRKNQCHSAILSFQVVIFVRECERDVKIATNPLKALSLLQVAILYPLSGDRCFILMFQK